MNTEDIDALQWCVILSSIIAIAAAFYLIKRFGCCCHCSRPATIHPAEPTPNIPPPTQIATESCIFQMPTSRPPTPPRTETPVQFDVPSLNLIIK